MDKMMSLDSGQKKKQIWVLWVVLDIQGVPKLVFASIIHFFHFSHFLFHFTESSNMMDILWDKIVRQVFNKQSL